MRNTAVSNFPAGPLRFHWRPLGEVQLDGDGQLHFPPVQAVPAIYRFKILRDGKPPAGYVGEAKKLSGRFSLYRTRGKKPSLPLSKKTTSRNAQYLIRALRKGRTVQVELLDGHVTDGNGLTVELDLANDTDRHEIEKLLIAELCTSDAKVLNRHGNPRWNARH